MAPESRDEVRQRIASLYDQAENATGNFNATRAMATRSRSRGVPLAKRPGRRPDPELAEVARQWFDAARAKLGPTVPAALPADRLSDGPAVPARSPERTGGLPGAEREVRALPGGGGALGLTSGGQGLGLPGGGALGLPGGGEALGLPGGGESLALTGGGERLGLPGGGRDVLALPGGERQALGDGGPSARHPEALERGAAQAVAELTAGSPADSASRPPQSPETARPALAGAGRLEPVGTAPALTGGAAAEPAGWGTPGQASTAALPAVASPTAQGTAAQPRPLPGAAASGRPSPAASKVGNRRKLDAARDLLSRHTGRLTLSGAAGLPAWAAGLQQVPHATAAEPTPPWQDPQWTASAPASARSTPATPAVDTRPVGIAAPATDTGSLPALTDTGPFSPVTDTGPFSPLTDTGPLAPLTDTGPLTPPTGTGPVAPPTDTGPLTPPTDTGPLTPPTDTGPLTPLTDTGPLAPLTDTGPLAPPTGTGPVAPPTDTGSLTPLTDTGSFTAPTAATGSAPLPLPVPAAAPESPRALRAAKAIAFARAQIGKPCVWGASGPDSYDCSGLTQVAWRAAGVTLSRTAHQQALAGTPVTLAEIEPGDLVLFFDDDRHVGLHVGDAMMVHAPGPGSSVREESIYGAGEAAIHRIVRPA
ncbi:C40 family peptidase [Streptomyces sp. PBH53]|uniref:C40 family peptidase n=1 Tax=Streptomyces sp. PBH53 TaxID=1577075 RepID=UPI000A84E53F|nr:NlpC/P60 family protein [Streptomyces sp. PBH53]